MSSSNTSIPKNFEKETTTTPSPVDPFGIFTKDDKERGVSPQKENTADALADFFGGGGTTVAPSSASSNPVPIKPQLPQASQDLIGLNSQSVPNSVSSSPSSSEQPFKKHHRKTSSTCSGSFHWNTGDYSIAGITLG